MGSPFIGPGGLDKMIDAIFGRKSEIEPLAPGKLDPETIKRLAERKKCVVRMGGQLYRITVESYQMEKP